MGQRRLTPRCFDLEAAHQLDDSILYRRLKWVLRETAYPWEPFAVTAKFFIGRLQPSMRELFFALRPLKVLSRGDSPDGTEVIIH